MLTEWLGMLGLHLQNVDETRTPGDWTSDVPKMKTPITLRGMRNRRFALPIVALSFLGLGLTLPTTTVAAAPPTATYLVTFKDGVDPQAQADQLRGQGHDVRYVYRTLLAGVAVSMPSTAAQNLAKNPNVALVEPDAVVQASTTQTGATWGLDRSDQRTRSLDTSFTYPTSAGRGVRVYVVDTGLLSTHSEFTGRVVSGYTSINDGRGTGDCNGHGTHVSGTAVGSTYGVAKQAYVVPVRVLDCNGSGSISGVVAGLDWIAANRVLPAVANMSLGGAANTTLDNAVSRLNSTGVAVVVAAGNSSANACSYSPSRVDVAITVGATTSGDARASYSNYGSCLDIFAPGSSITSAWSTGSTATNTISGTSMASPHVAGAVALLLGVNPNLTPAQIGAQLAADATLGVVTSAGTGSANRLLYVVSTSSDSTAPTTTVAPTTTQAPTTSTTTIPKPGSPKKATPKKATVIKSYR